MARLPGVRAAEIHVPSVTVDRHVLCQGSASSPSSTFAWKRHMRSERGKVRGSESKHPRGSDGDHRVRAGPGGSGAKCAGWPGSLPRLPAPCRDPTPPECRGSYRLGLGAGPLAPNHRAWEGRAPRGKQEAAWGAQQPKTWCPGGRGSGPSQHVPTSRATKTQGFQTPQAQGGHCSQGPARQAGLLLPALLHEHVMGPRHVTGAGHVTGPGHVMGPRHRGRQSPREGACAWGGPGAVLGT